MKEEDTKNEQVKLMRNNLAIIFFIFTSSLSCSVLKPNTYLLKSNHEKALTYSNQINSEALKKHLSILASDDFEGRETTTLGQKKAAEYIKNHFIGSNIGFPPVQKSYFQEFKVDVSTFSNVNLKINDSSLIFINDFYSFGTPLNTESTTTKLLPAGYGIINKHNDDYNGLDVNGAVVALKRGIPESKNYKPKEGSWRSKVKTAYKKGAVGVVLIENDYKNTDLRIKEYLKYPIMKMHGNQTSKPHIPVFIVDRDIIKTLKKDSLNITFSTNITEPKPAENVLGFIPGRKDEIIVISAHYDHIGYNNGEICNGADDDGSGTSALLEIAKTFQKATDDGHIPERGLLFLAVSGEEKGLYGSQYYTDNPVFPLSKTTLDLNIDMVGRKDTIQTNSNYIYLIGSNRISKELHNISEQVNKKHINFFLDYTYNDINDPNKFYERSDHYNFAKNNIPVIFYFGGLHEDYHKPTDDVEKIDFQKLEKVTKYVFLTAWELAYRKEAIKK